MLGAQEERTTTWPDGSVHERFTVDAQGRKQGNAESFREDGTRIERATYRDDLLDGRRETFHPNGKRAELSSWRKGVLDGPFDEHDESGQWKRAGAYRAGRLHGELRITSGRKTLTRQKWLDGELVELDGITPFPVRQDVLRATLAAILAPPAGTTEAPAGDPLAPEREKALRRLQAYRCLCRVPHEGMTLVPEWNELCDAAAEVCSRNGELSHEPPKPSGMDEARYQQGYLGASRSNLSGGSMVHSVDNYMDDSDRSNIDRIGHRRWCLNPGMRKTAFGWHDNYTAMWSMDSSGSLPRGIDAVLYPPAGWVPSDFFEPHIAWSIAPLRGGTPKKDELRVTIRRLDEHWLPIGDPLALDWLDVAADGYGTGACIVFRPVGLDVTPGAKWLCEVSVDGGKTLAWRYVVAFCEPVGARER